MKKSFLLGIVDAVPGAHINKGQSPYPPEHCPNSKEGAVLSGSNGSAVAGNLPGSSVLPEFHERSPQFSMILSARAQ